MKIIKGYPPIFKRIAEAFPIKGRQGILYSWGNVLWNPSNVIVTPWIMAHEEVHGARQLATSVDDWWDMYIRSAVFRYHEEALAHQAEWKAYNGPNPASYLTLISERLSSPLYGRLLSFNEAREAILHGSDPSSERVQA